MQTCPAAGAEAEGAARGAGQKAVPTMHLLTNYSLAIFGVQYSSSQGIRTLWKGQEGTMLRGCPARGGKEVQAPERGAEQGVERASELSAL